MSGTIDKIKGEIKETVGQVTGDKRLEAEGTTDKIKGDVKNAVHDATKPRNDAVESAKGVRDSLSKG